MSDTSGHDGCDELQLPVDRMIDTLLLTVAAGVVGLAIFFFFWRRGQFDDCEDVKYTLFRDDNDAEIP